MPDLIEPGPQRYPECLHVLRDGFSTQLEQYRITPQNDPGYPAFWPAERIAELVARPMTLLAAEVDGRIVGCCFTGASRSEDAWTLRHLTVAPPARHRGYGELLVAAAAARALSAGAKALQIGIIAENLLLVDWYHRLGFVTTASGNRYASLPFTVDHLELPLGPGRLGDSSRPASSWVACCGADPSIRVSKSTNR